MIPLALRLTDTPFRDSPDVGEEDCLCSRCGGQIMEVAIRAWSAHEDGEREYRYHPECLEDQIIPVPEEDEEDEEWEDEDDLTDDGPVEEL